MQTPALIYTKISLTTVTTLHYDRHSCAANLYVYKKKMLKILTKHNYLSTYLFHYQLFTKFMFVVSTNEHVHVRVRCLDFSEENTHWDKFIFGNSNEFEEYLYSTNISRWSTLPVFWKYFTENFRFLFDFYTQRNIPNERKTKLS